MSTALAIVLVAAVAVIGGASVLAVSKMRSAQSIDASAGAGGVKLSVTAQAIADDSRTVVALARQLGELDGRVHCLEVERAADKTEIGRLNDALIATRAELAETRRMLNESAESKAVLMVRIAELEAHVARLEAAAAARY